MNAQKNAQRAAEIALLASVWMMGSGILMALGPIAWSGGELKLGVAFPHAQVIIVNIVAGFVALVMSAARAWNHQPPVFGHIASMAGVLTMAVPIFTDAPAYMQQHNLLAGLALAVAAAISASVHTGPIGEAAVPAWEVAPKAEIPRPGRAAPKREPEPEREPSQTL
jgi:hypothetical protein